MWAAACALTMSFCSTSKNLLSNLPSSHARNLSINLIKLNTTTHKRENLGVKSEKQHGTCRAPGIGRQAGRHPRGAPLPLPTQRRRPLPWPGCWPAGPRRRREGRGGRAAATPARLRRRRSKDSGPKAVSCSHANWTIFNSQTERVGACTPHNATAEEWVKKGWAQLHPLASAGSKGCVSSPNTGCLVFLLGVVTTPNGENGWKQPQVYILYKIKLFKNFDKILG